MGGHVEVARELLAKGADKEVATNLGRTPLIVACENGHLAAATLLIVEHGAAINHLDNDGWSALRWAKECVRLDAGEPDEGEEPPTAAQRAEHKKLKFLKSHGVT